MPTSCIVTHTAPADKGDLLYFSPNETASFAVTHSRDTYKVFLQTCLSLVGLTADGLIHNIEVHPLIIAWLKLVNPIAAPQIRHVINGSVGVQKLKAYENFNTVLKWIYRSCDNGLIENIGNNPDTAHPTVWHYIIPLSCKLTSNNVEANKVDYKFDNSALKSEGIYSDATFLNATHCYKYDKQDKLALHTVRILFEKTSSEELAVYKTNSYIWNHNLQPELVDTRLAAIKQIFPDDSTLQRYIDEMETKERMEGKLLHVHLEQRQRYFNDRSQYKTVSVQNRYELPFHEDCLFPTADILNATTQAISGNDVSPRRADLVNERMALIQKMPTNQTIPYYKRFESIQAVVDNLPTTGDDHAPLVCQLINIANESELSLLEMQLRTLVPFVRKARCTIRRPNDHRPNDKRVTFYGELAGISLELPSTISGDEFASYARPSDSTFFDVLIFPLAKGSTLQAYFEHYKMDPKFQVQLSTTTKDTDGTMTANSFKLLKQLMALRFSSAGVFKASDDSTTSLASCARDRYTILAKYQLWIDLKLFMLISTYKLVSDPWECSWVQLQMEVLVKLHALLNLDEMHLIDATSHHSYILQDLLSKCTEMEFHGIMAKKTDFTWCSSPEISVKQLDRGFLADHEAQLHTFSKNQCSPLIFVEFDTIFASLMRNIAGDSMSVSSGNSFSVLDTLESTWCPLLATNALIKMTDCIFEPEHLKCFVVSHTPDKEASITALEYHTQSSCVNVFTKAHVSMSDLLSQQYCQYEHPKGAQSVGEGQALSHTLVMQIPGTCPSQEDNNFRYMRAYVNTIPIPIADNDLSDLAPFMAAPNFCLHMAACAVGPGFEIWNSNYCHVVPYQYLAANGIQTLQEAPQDITKRTGRIIPEYVENLDDDARTNEYYKMWRTAGGDMTDDKPELADWLKYAYTKIGAVWNQDTIRMTVARAREAVTRNRDNIPNDNHETLGLVFLYMLHDKKYANVLNADVSTMEMKMDFDEDEEQEDEDNAMESDDGSADAFGIESSFVEYTQSCMSDAIHADLLPAALLDFPTRMQREMPPHVLSELADKAHFRRSLTSSAFTSKVLNIFPALSPHMRQEWEPWVAEQHAAVLAI